MTKNLSNIIKKLYGNNVSVANIPMETFYSEQELIALDEEGGAIIEMAKEKSAKMVAEATAKAQAIVENAKIQGEQLLQQSRTAGYQEGLVAARTEVNADMDAVVVAINQIKQLLDRNLAEVFHAIEVQVLDMVVEIARKIVGYEIAMNKTLVLDIISKCLTKTKERNHLLIKVNKSDFDMVEEKKDIFLKKIRGLKSIEIEESELVFEGGCIIETSIGDINGDIDEQFHKIRDALLSE